MDIKSSDSLTYFSKVDSLIQAVSNYDSINEVAVHCPNTLHFVGITSDYVEPKFEVTRENGVFTITMPVYGKDSSMVSFVKPYSFNVEDVTSFCHNFAFHPLTESTDKSLKFIQEMKSETDKLSPDDIRVLENFILVMEYTTSIYEIDEDGAQIKAQNKRAQYYSSLLERLDKKPIFLAVMIATTAGVYINIELNDHKLINEIVMRYRFSLAVGIRIQEVFATTVFFTEEKSKRVRALESLLQSIPIDPIRPDLFTDECIEWCKKTELTRQEMTVVDEHVKTAMKRAVESTKEELGITEDNKFLIHKKIDDRMSEISEKFQNIIDEQGERTRADMKAVVQVPFICMKDCFEWENEFCYAFNFDDFILGPKPSTTKTLIYQSIIAIEENVDHFGEWTEELAATYALKPERQKSTIDSENKKNRTLYHRTTPRLSYEIQENLAKLGVNGKKFKRNRLVKEYRDGKKASFSLNCVTSDIDEFLNDAEVFNSPKDDYDIFSRESAFTPIWSAYSNGGNSAEQCHLAHKVVRNHWSSYLGRWASLITDIAVEVSISLKQNVKGGQWIMKKLKKYNLYLLIKPTNSTSHIFFSLFWRNNQMIFKSSSSVFKSIETDGTFSWTEPISMNTSKLVNWCNFESQTFMNCMFEMENMDICVPKGETIFGSSNLSKVASARKNILLCSLVTLNDKLTLDDLMSNARFICMEGFKSFPITPNPGKMMHKLPLVYRSRLEVWVAHRLKQTGLTLLSQMGYSCSNQKSKESKIRWRGLFDPFTQVEYSTPSQLVNSFYYNYAKNKDESAQGNSAMKMITKILEYEEKMPKDTSYLGSKSKPDMDYEFHEFSPELTKYLSLEAGKKLSKTLGSGWKKILTNMILSDMSNMSLNDLATMKASSGFTEKSDEREPHRPRAAEAVADLWRENGEQGYMVMDLMNISFRKLREVNGLRIDLFKKAQHCSLREISVMTMPARVIQSLLERIAKTICYQFQSETVTHPKNKFVLPSRHSKREAEFGETTLTIATSDDAKKWNQAHMVTKYAIILCSFTEPVLHSFIINGLSMWLNKQIYLPQEVLNTLDKFSIAEVNKMNIGDDFLKRIHKVYKGESEERWMKPGDNFIVTSTGMMQGLLHYTSSLTHVIVQEHYGSLVESLLADQHNCKCLVTVMQGSDDSGSMITLPYEDQPDLMNKIVICYVCFRFKHKLGNMVAIYESEKSTTGTVNVLEYNSEFFFWSNLVRPTRKWVLACTALVETPSIYARQELFYNLASQVLEGGGSFFLTSMCQIAQAYLHYKLLGSTVSPLWPKFMAEIDSMNDMTLGYFYLDNCKYAGLASVKFGLWLMSSGSHYLRSKMKGILQDSAVTRSDTLGKEVDTQDIIDILSSGSITESMIVRYANTQKWKRLIQNLNFPENWRETIEADPRIIYSHASSPLDFITKLAVFAHGPGIGASLAKGNAITRIVASSVFILTHSILSIKGGMTDLDGVTIVYKTSLYKKTVRDRIKYDEDLSFTVEELKVLFPLSDSYKSLMKTAQEIKVTEGRYYKSDLRRKKTDLVVFEAPTPTEFSLEKIVTWKWFGMSIPISKTMAERFFQTYKAGLAWLRSDPKTTLKNSPFLDQIMLQNFLSRNDYSDRVVRLTAAPIQGLRGKSALTTAIKQNFWPNWKLITEDDKNEGTIKGDRPTALPVLAQGLFMTAHSEMSKSSINRACYELLRTTDDLFEPDFRRGTDHPSVCLYLAQKLIKMLPPGTPKSWNYSQKQLVRKVFSDWLGLCNNFSLGTIGHYIIRQRFDTKTKRYHGKFQWNGKMDKCLLMIEGTSSKDHQSIITEVRVSNIDHFREAFSLFKTWMRDNQAVILKEHVKKVDKNVVGRIKEDHLYADLRFSADGCPVLASPEFTFLELDERWFDSSSLSITLDQTRLRISGYFSRAPSEDNAKDVMLTVLSCSVPRLEKYVSRLPLDAFRSDIFPLIWRYWACNQKFPSWLADAILESLMKGDSEAKAEGYESQETVLAFFRKHFSYACHIIGLYNDPDEIAFGECLSAAAEKHTFEDLQKFSALRSNDVFNSFKENLSEVLPSTIETGYQDYEQRLEDTMTMMAEMRQKAFDVVETGTKIEERVKRMPRELLISWIDDIARKAGYEELRVLIHDGKISASLRHVEDKFAFLLGVDEFDYIEEEVREEETRVIMETKANWGDSSDEEE